MASFKRLKKQSTSANFNHVQPFKVAVFGQEGVGKTAFIVRFATSKFIGEYDKALEYVYQCSMMIPPAYPVYFEILDTCGKEENDEVLIEKIKWADAFVLLYSVTDRVSFSELTRIKFSISHHTTHTSHKSHNSSPRPVAIVGNKKDMDVERMVTTEEGKFLAEGSNSLFFEISVRESAEEVTEVFEALYKAGKIKFDLLSRAKSNSLLELPLVSHHLTTKKSKNFKHINKFPRMQGSPEMRRAFRHIPETTKSRLSAKLSADSDYSGDERFVADKLRTPTKSLKVATKTWRISDSRFEYSSSGNSSDDLNLPQTHRRSDPLPEEFAKQIAEDFQKKTLLLTLE